MNATDQATEWTEALGEYSKGATASRKGRGVMVESRKSKVAVTQANRARPGKQSRGSKA
ncbi:MAG: hypothetical protein WAN16_03225 [Chthoniobacterales bacterium]